MRLAYWQFAGALGKVALLNTFCQMKSAMLMVDCVLYSTCVPESAQRPGCTVAAQLRAVLQVSPLLNVCTLGELVHLSIDCHALKLFGADWKLRAPPPLNGTVVSFLPWNS